MYEQTAQSLGAAQQRLAGEPLPLPEGRKACGRCGQIRHVERFGRHASRPDGLQDWCRECKAEHQATSPAYIVGTQLSAERRDLQLQLAEQGLAACETCGTTYALTLFPEDARTRTGRATTCIHCRRDDELERIMGAELQRHRDAGLIW